MTLSRKLTELVGLAVALMPWSAAAQSGNVTTVSVNGNPVHPAQYGYVYTSSLTSSDIRLQDGSRGEVWMFEGVAGECAAIVMQSPDFDPYLVLRFGAPFGELVAQDDDGGDGTDALLRLRLQSTGTYFITATTYGEGQALGSYSLDVDRC